MGRLGNIDTKIWGDRYFERLSRPKPNSQTLFIYLLAGPHVDNGFPGLYFLGPMGLAESLNWPVKATKKCLNELESIKKDGPKMLEMDAKKRVVWLPSAVKYSDPDNPNIMISWAKAWLEVPECDLKYKALRAVVDFVKTNRSNPPGLYKGLAKGFGEGFEDSMKHIFPEIFNENGMLILSASDLKKPSTRQRQRQPRSPNCPYYDILEVYKTICVPAGCAPFTGDLATSNGLKTQIRQRFNTSDKTKDIEFWQEYFNKVSESDFLTGKKTDWKADFVWLMRRSNFEKVSAGTYAESGRAASAPDVKAKALANEIHGRLTSIGQAIRSGGLAGLGLSKQAMGLIQSEFFSYRDITMNSDYTFLKIKEAATSYLERTGNDQK